LNFLAFDTSTERMSVAARTGAGPVQAMEGAGGAQTSATLIPAIQSLLGQAGIGLRSLDAIVFGRGPGSFTGLRTACSVAQGLGFGAGVPVLGVATLMAVAEEARVLAGVTRVVAVLDARMDEVYWAQYAHEGGLWRETAAPALGRPEDVTVPPGATLAGNALTLHDARLAPGAPRLEAWPTAAALLRLAPGLLAAGQATAAAQALPLYVRDKVAQTVAERAAQRAGSTP
jgi:tRNA threonylcarbamoyladenosine biosynthesis protein TsaB